MPPRKHVKPTKPSPGPVMVPVEVEALIFKLYSEASTRHSILKSIHEHVERLQAQERHAEIPAFLQQEIDAMKEEERQREKTARRKLLSVVGRVGLAALLFAAHWHW